MFNHYHLYEIVVFSVEHLALVSHDCCIVDIVSLGTDGEGQGQNLTGDAGTEGGDVAAETENQEVQTDPYYKALNIWVSQTCWCHTDSCRKHIWSSAR